MPTGTFTSLGRYQVPDPPRFDLVHFHQGAELKAVVHQPPTPVLDQEDLLEQGIHVSQIVPGARDVDALGSCTANAGVSHIAERVGAEGLTKIGLFATDPVADEVFAIKFYHSCTGQTGDPSQEFPPNDPGSTGLFVCQEYIKMGLASSYKMASGVDNLASLLQDGSVMLGTVWFNEWFTPGADAFVDGNGSLASYLGAIRSGVAGGHEVLILGIEKLALTVTGKVDASKTTVLVRNSWDSTWGDNGCFRMHMSTLQHLGGHADFKQLVI